MKRWLDLVEVEDDSKVSGLSQVEVLIDRYHFRVEETRERRGILYPYSLCALEVIEK